MTIVPVSDLRDYNKILPSIETSGEVILTKNGRSKYVVADYEEWQKMKATLALFTEIQKGVLSLEQEGALSIDDLDAEFA